MAYSDYGGYAYKDGKRREDRSDAVIDEGLIKSTPGMWPGFTIPAGRAGGSYHVLLGDGPIFVGLYKQSTVSVSRLGESIDLLSIAVGLPEEAIGQWDDGEKYLDTSFFSDGDYEDPARFEIDGYRIEVYWIYDDNYYQFVKLSQPDGSVWHGWSGYGVGAGLEDYGYGYSTSEQVQRIKRLWPESIRKDGD